MISLKKNLKKTYKFIIQCLFKFIYGQIKIASSKETNKLLLIENTIIEEINYNIFKTKNSRLYTTSVHDQSVIVNNKLIPGPSFQLRVKSDDKFFARNNGTIDENIALKIGTPRILKKIKGSVFSLLSGGAAKNNYFHWLFEILPRLEIIKKIKKIKDIDFFLLPSTKLKYHNESMEMLNINSNKLLDSTFNKHIFCDELFIVDHPFRLTNNSTYDNQNIPNWIFNWIRKKFLDQRSSNVFSEKIFIDRAKSISVNRDIVNKDEVYRMFKKNDYQFIKLEEYEIKDQIRIFFSAKKIAGLHGAGFANICFCKPNTKIIEFKTSQTGMDLGNIALKNNLDYKGIVCEAIDSYGSQQGKLVVSLESLKNEI